MALALVATSLIATAQTPQLEKVVATQVGNGHLFVISGNGLSRPTSRFTEGGINYVLEFDGIGTRRDRIQVNRGGVSFVSFGWTDPREAKTRVIFRINRGVKPILEQKANEFWVWVNVSESSRSAYRPGGNSQGNGTPSAVKTPVGQANKGLDAVKTPEAQGTSGTLPRVPGSGSSKMPLPHPAVNKSGEANSGTGAMDPIQGGLSVSRVEETRRVEQPPTNATPNPVRVSNPSPTPASPAVSPSNPLVSLDFVGTDVIQILKALAIQSGVNIIASPDVSPSDKPVRLTVSLTRVTLDDSLRFITAMAGLRYGKFQNTYFVTPAPNFASAVRQLMERMGGKYETRVVNLISGEAAQIREAALKAMPPDGSDGFYEIIIPEGTKVSVSSSEQQKANQPQAGASGGDSQAGGRTNETTQTVQGAELEQVRRARTYYLMVVGDPARMDSVVSYISELDTKLAEAFSLQRISSITTSVMPAQSGDTGRIKSTLESLMRDNPQATDIKIQETLVEGTNKFETRKGLIFVGPQSEIDRIVRIAKSLDRQLCEMAGIPYSDDTTALQLVNEVVAVNFIDPGMAEHEIRTRIRGIQVSTLPMAVTPGSLTTTSSSETSSSVGGTDGGAKQSTSQPGSQTSESKSDKTLNGTEPMKLMLTGTKAQIEEAKKVLAMIDIAPKQVALELRVMELRKEDALRLGINWNALTGGTAVRATLNQGLGDAPATPGTVSYNDSSLSVLGTLDKMANDRNLIARPNALVSDGRTVRLFVGDTVRYIKTIQTSQNGTTVQTDEINVGVVFDASVRIGSNDSIAMNLDQNFSILTGFTPVPGGGQLPQTSDRRTSMFVNMKSGETLAIGGLILDQDRKKVSGIPILMDLPIIGKLFSRTDNSRDRTEIVFFLTAVVVDSTNRSNAASPRNSASRTPDPVGDYRKTGPGIGDKK
jgi:type II secretory pathway component GspD/PulD (secretin)